MRRLLFIGVGCQVWPQRAGVLLARPRSACPWARQGQRAAPQPLLRCRPHACWTVQQCWRSCGAGTMPVQARPRGWLLFHWQSDEISFDQQQPGRHLRVWQVQALRAVEPHLGLEKLYVLGTNCVDNGPRQGLATFLAAASTSPDTVLHYEFMQVQVHLSSMWNM